MATSPAQAPEASEISIEECLADTREQLKHVLQVTEDSANKTMDLVENLLAMLRELIERSDKLKGHCQAISEDPAFQQLPERNRELLLFMEHLDDHSATMRGGLQTVMETQEFQDISGQIINRIVELLVTMEESLSDSAAIRIPSSRSTNGSGPTIKPCKETHCAEQGDVDDLLAGLGL